MEVLRKSAAEVLEVFDRSVSDKELVIQAKALYRDYVLSRLSQHGLGWAKSELHFPASSTSVSEVSLVLLYLGDELECMHPSLYRNVARQLNISVAMENMVSDAFIAVATEIFATGITWAQGGVHVWVATGLGGDCWHVLVDSLGQLVRRYLVPWLKRRGGWTEITKCVIKRDVASEHHWLSSTVETLKYFLTTVYVYVMKEQ
ncbi:hypothetical protein CRUP_005961 [Coryphaenoides rupestris]|nr:hypothetical protein CRUP_005961 [Coryphaenoides rupestris]